MRCTVRSERLGRRCDYHGRVRATPRHANAAGSAPGEEWLEPLDRLRVRLLLAARPLSSRLAADRSSRVLVMAMLIVGSSLVLALRVPLWLLALGPVALGVPHLVADLRYCGIRTGLLTRRRLLLAGGLPMVAVGLGAGLWVGLVGMAAVFVVSKGPTGRRAAGALLASVAAIVAFRHPIGSTLLMAHAHNFVAVAMWWSWRARPRQHALIPLLVVGTSLLIVLGATDAVVEWGAGSSLASLGKAEHLARLAPDLPPHWGLRLVVLYAFAQSVHYGVWLHLVREDDRARPTPRTVRASYRALHAEFGSWALVAATAALVGLVGWSLLDLAGAREGYFRLAQFHGSLELCALALMLTEGRPCSSPG